MIFLEDVDYSAEPTDEIIETQHNSTVLQTTASEPKTQ